MNEIEAFRLCAAVYESLLLKHPFLGEKRCC